MNTRPDGGAWERLDDAISESLETTVRGTKEHLTGESLDRSWALVERRIAEERDRLANLAGSGDDVVDEWDWVALELQVSNLDPVRGEADDTDVETVFRSRLPDGATVDLIREAGAWVAYLGTRGHARRLAVRWPTGAVAVTEVPTGASKVDVVVPPLGEVHTAEDAPVALAIVDDEDA